MSEDPRTTGARMAGDHLRDYADNDVDEGIALMREKPSWPPLEVLKYLNTVRRGRLIKAILMALISQIPLILVLLTSPRG